LSIFFFIFFKSCRIKKSPFNGDLFYVLRLPDNVLLKLKDPLSLSDSPAILKTMYLVTVFTSALVTLKEQQDVKLLVS